MGLTVIGPYPPYLDLVLVARVISPAADRKPTTTGAARAATYGHLEPGMCVCVEAGVQGRPVREVNGSPILADVALQKAGRRRGGGNVGFWKIDSKIAVVGSWVAFRRCTRAA